MLKYSQLYKPYSVSVHHCLKIKTDGDHKGITASSYVKSLSLPTFSKFHFNTVKSTSRPRSAVSLSFPTPFSSSPHLTLVRAPLSFLRSPPLSSGAPLASHQHGAWRMAAAANRIQTCDLWPCVAHLTRTPKSHL